MEEMQEQKTFSFHPPLEDEIDDIISKLNIT